MLCGGEEVEGERNLMLGKLGKLCEQDLRLIWLETWKDVSKRGPLSHWEAAESTHGPAGGEGLGLGKRYWNGRMSG